MRKDHDKDERSESKKALWQLVTCDWRTLSVVSALSFPTHPHPLLSCQEIEKTKRVSYSYQHKR